MAGILEADEYGIRDTKRAKLVRIQSERELNYLPQLRLFFFGIPTPFRSYGARWAYYVPAIL